MTVTAQTLPPPEVRQHIAAVIVHRPVEDRSLPAYWLGQCAECGYHFPCPPYFQARRALEVANVHPHWWAY